MEIRRTANAGVLLKNVDTRVVFDAPESLFVWSDEFKVEEVFMNYCCCCCNHVPQIEESLHDYFPEESCLTKGNQSKR